MRRERARRRTRRQRRALLAVLVAAVLAAAALLLPRGNERTGGDGSGRGEGGAASARVAASPAARGERPSLTRKVTAPPQLPRGGRLILPRYRVVGFYGAPQSEELGILGIGTPASAERRLRGQAGGYVGRGRPIMLAFQLLAAIASSDAGGDGKYRTRQSDEVIRRYLRAARRAKALLVLDIQPGRADFLSEVKALRPYLEQPDVGLALDPEWRMGPGEVPGQQIGSTDAATVNAVSAYLAGIVKRKNLPQKLLIVHQFTAEMITSKRALKRRPGIALTIMADGFGSQAAKISKYRSFADRRGRYYNGLKLFYKEDTDLMQPREVLALRPPPDVVIYE